MVCQRRHFKILKKEVELPHHYFYCKNCLQLGHLTSHDTLYYLAEPNYCKIKFPILIFVPRIKLLDSLLKIIKNCSL